MTRKTFNTSPYLDDFSSKKNFMRVLFKPSVPVQTRELNQMQSIISNQIEKFANHIFKHGSRVTRGSVSLNNYDYVRLENYTANADNTLSNVLVVAGSLHETVLVGKTSGIKAKVIYETEKDSSDPATLYVIYLSAGVDNATTKFLDGEVLELKDSNNVVLYRVKVKCPSCPGNLADPIRPTGKGQIVTTEAGTWYVNGFFVETENDYIIASKYTTTATATIGYDIVESIVSHLEDATLLDNALGYPNYSAPGADRYKISLRLSKRTLDFSDGDNFIKLITIENGAVTYISARTDYSDIMDLLAERTYDESGHYTVNPFFISFKDDLKKSSIDPNGFLTLAEGGDKDYLRAILTPGKAYVKGYLVEKTSNTNVKIRKARDTKKYSNFLTRTLESMYVLVKPHLNSNLFQYNSLLAIYDGVTAGTTPGGAVIGHVRVSNVVYSHTDLADSKKVYKAYIHDLSMNIGKTFSMAKSFYINDEGLFLVDMVSDAVSHVPTIFNADVVSTNIVPASKRHIKTLRDADDSSKSSVMTVIRKEYNVILNSSGVGTITAPTNEYFSGDMDAILILKNGTTSEYSINDLATISSTANELTINASVGEAGKTAYITLNVVSSNALEKTKTKTVGNVLHTQIIDNMIKFDYADIIKLTSVIRESDLLNVTDKFTIDNGVRDNYYQYGKLTVKAGATGLDLVNDRFTITFDYFLHTGSSSFFNIDSYNAMINDDLSGFTYQDVPNYSDKTSNTKELRNCFDFRYIADHNGNPVGNYAYPAPQSDIFHDIEFYLPRVDTLVVNKAGSIYQVYGVSSETPKPAKIEKDVMVIYEIYQAPFVYEILTDVKPKYIENKRYTMRDIGRLENRIENLEYYVVLNQLENDTLNKSIKDENGLDRYKNGFISDDFSEYRASNLTHPEFRCALDRKRNEMRPSYEMTSRKLKLNTLKSSISSILQKGKVIMNKFTEEKLIAQPYATKSISINPFFIYKTTGSMVLSPNTDVWSDTTREPPLVVDVDTGVDALRQITNNAGVLGTEWGAWSEVNRTVVGISGRSTQNTVTNRIAASSSSSVRFNNLFQRILGTGERVTTTRFTDRDTTTTTTTTRTTEDVEQIRSGVDTSISSRTDSYNLGDRVTDVRILPYMRATSVEFIASKLVPNARMYAFFNDVPVTEFCRQFGKSSKTNGNNELIVDANGNLTGEFNIPEGRFFTGRAIFRLTNDATDSSDPDVETSVASAEFFAGGLDQTKQSTTLNVTTPVVTTTNVSDSRTVRDVNVDVNTTVTTNDRTTVNQVVTCAPGFFLSLFTNTCQFRRPPGDPVAQSFIPDRDSFITSLETFFHTKETDGDTIFAEIRTTVNGFPSSEVLGRIEVSSNNLNVSADSTIGTTFTFPYPIRVEAGVEYCFVIGGYSPNTRIFVSKLGGEVLNIPGKIVDTQPHLGSSFRSQNGRTWTAEQFEDIKFNLNFAKFNTDVTTGKVEMTLVLSPEDETEERLRFNPIETEVGTKKVRVFIQNHGFAVNDRLILDMYRTDDLWVTLNVASGTIVPGHEIITATGRFKVSKVRTDGATVQVQIYGLVGKITANAAFTTAASSRFARDTYVSGVMGMSQDAVEFRSLCSGTVVTNLDLPVNGIPLEEFTLEAGHLIKVVDSVDSVIIEVSSNASVTEYFGGNSVFAKKNKKYEIFNISGSKSFDGLGYSMYMRGTKHAPQGGLFDTEDYVQSENIAFNFGNDVYLDQPFKLVTDTNRNRLSAGSESVEVVIKLSSTTPYLCPVINLDTVSMITISNRVEWLTDAAFNVEPNSANRFVAETNNLNGTENFKYITKEVSLKNPARDIKMFLDVYKDQNADFDIYYKMTRPWDYKKIDDQSWTKLNILTKTNSTDAGDFIEYEWQFSEVQGVNWVDEDISSFQIKIVGKTKNPARCVRFMNFRAIAIT